MIDCQTLGTRHTKYIHYIRIYTRCVCVERVAPGASSYGTHTHTLSTALKRVQPGAHSSFLSKRRKKMPRNRAYHTRRREYILLLLQSLYTHTHTYISMRGVVILARECYVATIFYTILYIYPRASRRRARPAAAWTLYTSLMPLLPRSTCVYVYLHYYCCTCIHTQHWYIPIYVRAYSIGRANRCARRAT